MGAASVRNNRTTRKPKKPHPDFPLTPHATGQFCKKIRGKTHYFGSDPDEAIRRYLAVKDHLLAGIDPGGGQAGDTVEWLCNAFMDSRQAKLNAGELSQRSLDDYHKTCKRIAKFFGKTRTLDSLGPRDFGPLKVHFQRTWGPTTVNNEIGRVRVILNYANHVDAIDTPIKTGPDFSRPSKKTLRLHRKEMPKKLFTAEQIHDLLGAACVQVKAMTLLGINAAYGNKDCGLLRQPWIDFERQWLGEMRNKTAVDREAWLWPETIEALREAIDRRKEPKDPENHDRVFITKFGNTWDKEGLDNPISKAFTKLTKKLEIHQRGVCFYALRHTFQTVAGNSRDQVAVDRVFGHEENRTASMYREEIDPQRIIDVCSFVREWWLKG